MMLKKDIVKKKYNKKTFYYTLRNPDKADHAGGFYCPECKKYTKMSQHIGTLRYNAKKFSGDVFVKCIHCGEYFDIAKGEPLTYGRYNVVDFKKNYFCNKNSFVINSCTFYLKPIANNATGYNGIRRNTDSDKVIFNFKNHQIYYLRSNFKYKKNNIFCNCSYKNDFFIIDEISFELFVDKYKDKLNLKDYSDIDNPRLMERYIIINTVANGNEKIYDILSALNKNVVGSHFRSKILLLKKQFNDNRITEQDFINKLVDIFYGRSFFNMYGKNPIDVYNNDLNDFLNILIISNMFRYYRERIDKKIFKTILLCYKEANSQFLYRNTIQKLKDITYETKIYMPIRSIANLDLNNLCKILNKAYLRNKLSNSFSDKIMYSTLYEELKAIIYVINKFDLNKQRKKAKKYTKLLNNCKNNEDISSIYGHLRSKYSMQSKPKEKSVLVLDSNNRACS